MDVNSRLKKLEELDTYLSEKNEILLHVIKSVGWDEETLTNEIKVQCPVNPSHWVQSSTLPQHIEMCTWVKEGYLKEEKDKHPPSSRGFYQPSSSVASIIVGKETQAKILTEKGLVQQNAMDEIPDLPKTMDRWSIELTSDQRLAVYDYVVEKFKSSHKTTNVTLEDLMIDFEMKNDQDGRPKTGLEILAEQRDYRRRRQSYRAKNVHITKKSYTEVMKEVIENQITYLAETRKQDDNERHEELSNNDKESTKDRDSIDSKYQRKSRRDRSSSPSPKRKKRKHKRSRSRSKSRHHKKSHKHKHKKSKDS
ncbi:hypothetical protein JTE90_001353 [Oedothorax gibbosus]|uniref:CHHC U11-48K-type domain-containing protein n=1 Tax=Oedothorax gibbosus TaxID=931172 RepID=A0AAV6VHA9_9ARAC|nr:hypothetical protein JTE90_001353 [Oedothorax gibbosus]